MTIRKASAKDIDSIWEIFEKVVAEGDTYAFAPDTTKEAFLNIWFAPTMKTYVAVVDGIIAGTYFIKPNQPGLGSHISNCGYMVHPDARGQGIGGKLCEHSLKLAKELGYKGMQYNIVVSTNAKAVEQLFPYIYPLLTDISFPCNTPANPPQQFWDAWLGSLPMDEFENSNNLFDLAYTEMWIPIDKTEATINAMENLYTTAGYAATGFYDTVILAAKSSNFWLSPGYNQDSVRINMMWFNKNIGDPVAFFQQFWSLMVNQNISFRPHWGKSLPAMGSAYMSDNYPKWGQWQALRSQMDPNNIFLTDYWATQLGL